MAGTPVTLPQPGDEITSSWGQSVAKAVNGIQQGSVSIPGIVSASQSSVPVTFPVPFAAAPTLVVNGNSVVVGWAATAVTATGFTALARRTDGVATAFNGTAQWIAVGALP